jgi:RNase P/RNase MRP subunit p29
MIKADFTGAYIKIIKSLNPTLINIKGIVAKETMRTFVIV